MRIYKDIYVILSVLSVFVLNGCSATTRTASPVPQDQKETTEALKSVAGALGGQEVDDKQLKALAVEMRKDPEAQSAVQAVAESLSGQNLNIKYCPVDGKRYSGDLAICPEHQVQLKKLDE